MSAIHAGWLPSLRLLFAAALIFAMAFIGLGRTRHLRHYTSSAARLAVYRSSIAMAWAWTGVAVVLAMPVDLAFLQRDVADVPWLLGPGIARAVTIALLGTFFVLFCAQQLLFGADAAWRARYARATRHFRYFLPVTPQERRWWLLVSLTAGICEELLFRGYLLQLLNGRMAGGVALQLTAAWLLSSAAFGFGHFYQGIKGALGAAFGGAVLGLLAILTGNLLLPIVVHALVDASALWTYRPQIDNPVEASLLVEGYDLTRDD